MEVTKLVPNFIFSIIYGIPGIQCCFLIEHVARTEYLKTDFFFQIIFLSTQKI